MKLRLIGHVRRPRLRQIGLFSSSNNLWYYVCYSIKKWIYINSDDRMLNIEKLIDILWYFSRRFFFVKMSSSSMWFFIPIYLVIISIKLLFNSTLFLNKWINSESFWTFLFFNDFVTRIFYNIINAKEKQFFMTRKKNIQIA